MSDLDGRVALVTGGAGGIGRAICRALAAKGATIAVCDVEGGAAARAARDLGEGHAAFQADISDSGAVAAVVTRAAHELGPIGILVNNAGIDKIERFVDSTEETWRAIVDVNYLGTVIVTRAVLDSMLEQRYGRIINVGSDAGRVGSSGEVLYSGTKGAIISFGKALAREVAAKGITVNTVCPGPTDTALLQQVADHSPTMFDALAKAVPMKRIGTPADIAPAVAFFAGPGAAFITGQTLSVSGGLTMV